MLASTINKIVLKGRSFRPHLAWHCHRIRVFSCNIFAQPHFRRSCEKIWPSAGRHEYPLQRSPAWTAEDASAVRIAMNRGVKLHSLAGAPAARPRPLEIVSTEPARDVHRLADDIETADLARLHRL
jgi:hypothetical protein